MAVMRGSGHEVMFVMRGPEQLYSVDEVVELVQLAQEMGLPMEKESWLDMITIRQLDALVRNKANGDA